MTPANATADAIAVIRATWAAIPIDARNVELLSRDFDTLLAKVDALTAERDEELYLRENDPHHTPRFVAPPPLTDDEIVHLNQMLGVCQQMQAEGNIAFSFSVKDVMWLIERAAYNNMLPPPQSVTSVPALRADQRPADPAMPTSMQVLERRVTELEEALANTGDAYALLAKRVERLEMESPAELVAVDAVAKTDPPLTGEQRDLLASLMVRTATREATSFGRSAVRCNGGVYSYKALLALTSWGLAKELDLGPNRTFIYDITDAGREAVRNG